MAYQPKSYRKFLAGTVSAAVVASAIAPVASAASFTDLAGNVHADDIATLVAQGYIKGYADGTFKPNKTLTRGEAAIIFSRILKDHGVEVPASAPKFADVSANNVELTEAVAIVSSQGVMTGDGARFNPSANITREQMAKVLVEAFKLTKPEGHVSKIADLDKAASWARDYIQTLEANGVTKNTQFNPKAAVTRGQFASFVVRALSLQGAVKNPEVKTVKAINATTVEVHFVDAISNINSLKFEIDGLEVKNAAVKQTDNKVAVLTTSTQEGGKEYTVKGNGKTLGKFKGISAVLPEKINVITNSVQGVVGKEVTVRAEVKVPEGQSKKGIPVTFNIQSDSRFNKDHVVEVYTNENGVAEYSYTQYAGGDDLVIAYATGKPEVRATNGKVYWGVAERLTITEVTDAKTLANGAKKVYKVKATTPSGGAASGYVNIAFAENVDVTPDKGVKGVTITDATWYQNPSVKYPYQYTNGNQNGVRVQLDSKGEATFTLTGANASVTPIVFFDGGDDKLGATELQAKASTVKFENVQLVEVLVESIGTKDAAAISVGGEGGRDYKVTVRDKDGKLAPKGTKVYVTIEKGNLDGKVWLQRSADQGGNYLFNGTNLIALETDKDGVVQFTLIGEKNAYATPTVFVDNGTKAVELDSADAQAKGEIVYFGDAKVEKATLKVYDASGKEVSSVNAGQTVTYKYQVVDQNGKEYKAGTHTATFEVYNNGFSPVVANGVTIEPYKYASIPFTAVNGASTLTVTANEATNVTVNVSGSQYTLPNQNVTVSFTKAFINGVSYALEVLDVDKVRNEVKVKVHGGALNGSEFTLNYNGAKLFVNGSPKSENEFELGLEKYDQIVYVHGDVASFDLRGDQVYAPVQAPAVTVTSAKAIDSNSDGKADKVEVTFSKAVNDSKLVAGAFALTAGTVASVSTGEVANDNVIVLDVTATGLDVGTLSYAEIASLATDGGKLAAGSVTVAPAAAVSAAFETVAGQKESFLAGTFAYRVSGKLAADVTATTVTVKIGTQTFTTNVNADKTFSISRLVAEDVASATVEVVVNGETKTATVPF
ncbi:S-layer homology domain-containing protein [Anoxybacillus sp. MB8]|uniref:S-layer homology domain-containing protein n=1 Tax=Anoxybacillus sp. MB8 TaxID=2496850 RepID=UPI0013D7CCAA|nr:S-layer homology domain-containing protein [Anoxybacillus sp. MB8]